MSEDGEGAGLEIKGMVGLSVAIGDLAGEMRHHRLSEERRRQAHIESQPRTVSVNRDFVIPAGATTGAWAVGSPERGYVWLLRRLWIGGNQITATPSGAAFVFVRPNSPVGDLGPANLVAQTAQALPQIAYWSNKQVAVMERERIWVYLTGATAGTQYVASGAVEQYTIDAYREAFEI